MTQPQTFEITVNGESVSVTSGGTLTGLVAEVTHREIDAVGQAVDGKRLGVAVARNQEIVARSKWSGTVLESGDQIEIVTAVQGG